MNVFKFLTQDELEDAPMDSREAFLYFVKLARARFEEQAAQIEETGNASELEDTQYGYVGFILILAKKYEIIPTNSARLPPLSSFSPHFFRQFNADLDQTLAHIALDASEKSRRESVLLSSKSKEKIRSYIEALKKTVDTSNFSDAKKALLLRRLTEFENLLEKRRLSVLEVTRIAIEILGAPGALWASADIANKLVVNVIQVVAEEKAAEDEGQLSSSAASYALAAPAATGEPEPTDPDDEIPF